MPTLVLQLLYFEMAVKPSSDLLKLEKELTCPVCLEEYTNPKILPCHHSFCQVCLEGLPQEREARGDTCYLSCPTCCQRTEVPREGVGAFPIAFHLNNLKEITQSLKNKVSDDSQQVICIDHFKPLDMFCETCDTAICHYCAFRTHEGHKHTLVSDCYPKHYQMLHNSLKPIKGKKEALKKVLSDLAEREGQIRERGEGILEEIHQMVEEMIGILRQSERKLTEQVKRVTDAKLQMLSGQTKSIQTSLSLLEDVEDYVEQSLKTGTHQQVLQSKKQMMECMSEVTTQINVEELCPIEKDDLRLIKESAETLKSLHHIGTVSYTSAMRQCKVKIFEGEKSLKEKKFSFSLSMEGPDSSLVSVPISSLRCSLVPVGKGDQPIHTTVTTTSTHPGVYRIHCNPSTRGTHTIKVQVYDVELEDTSLVIPFNPYLDNITPVRTITELNYPWGVAIRDDGHVIVTECRGHCVTILDNEGKKVKSLGGEGGSGNVEFSNPHGVAITPDNFILVSDDHRIQKISMDGDHVASVGGRGSGQQQFNKPYGIAISPITGQVYIADRNNHRIQVLNRDLTSSRSFGGKGSANGQFRYPFDIAIDSQGLVYVTDKNNHRIQKFTPDGKFLAQFSSKGSGPGQLKYPRGITIDTAGTGLVYVCETSNNRVSVFTSDGVFVSSFGGSGFNLRTTRRLTFDKKGFLYVCDFGSNQLDIHLY